MPCPLEELSSLRCCDACAMSTRVFCNMLTVRLRVCCRGLDPCTNFLICPLSTLQHAHSSILQHAYCEIASVLSWAGPHPRTSSRFARSVSGHYSGHYSWTFWSLFFDILSYIRQGMRSFVPSTFVLMIVCVPIAISARSQHDWIKETHKVSIQRSHRMRGHPRWRCDCCAGRQRSSCDYLC